MGTDALLVCTNVSGIGAVPAVVTDEPHTACVSSQTTSLANELASEMTPVRLIEVPPRYALVSIDAVVSDRA